MADDAPLIMGVSGLRGIVGRSLTPEVAARYAAAFGVWLREHAGGCEVGVARDGRAGGEAIYHAAISGLLGVGCDVTPLGVAPTPTAGLAVDAGTLDGAIVVTASHNPQEWNGLKGLVQEPVPDLSDDGGSSGASFESAPDDGARAPSAREAQRIIDVYEGFSWQGCNEPDARLLPEASPLIEHAEAVETELVLASRDGRLHDRLGGVRVVLDSVNASGAEAAGLLMRRLGVQAIQLCGDGSGVFPHAPEPTAANLAGEGGLCDAVPGLKARIGFAQDPDADRLAIIDERGRYIGEEYTLALATLSVLEALGEDAAGSVLVANLSTSRMVEDVAGAFGARVERTPVGEANVVERMKALRARGESVVLGGEGNGGVIWPEVVYVRDSLSAMGLVLALMARSEGSVSELVERVGSMSAGGSGYAMEKRKVSIASRDEAGPAVEKVGQHWSGERVDRQDGVRVDFEGEGAWLHVRASNTEPIMRLICEAPTQERARAILDEAARVIGG